MGRISPERALRRSANSRKRVRVGGRDTSLSLEDAFWDALKEIADIRGIRRADLVSVIKSEHQGVNLSSEMRLFVLNYYRSLCVKSEGRGE